MTFGGEGDGGGAGRSGSPRGDAGEQPDHRAIAWLLVAAGGLAACITFLFLGMRAVMDIGGACASGGPFIPVQPCPDGVPALMTIGTLGLFGFGGLGLWAGAKIGGGWAALPLLAWPGLFLSLGWNFLEYGISPPGDEPGPAIGWLFCGVIFVLMGAVPLWIAISARNELREGGTVAVASRFGVGERRPGAVPRSSEPPQSRPSTRVAAAGPESVSAHDHGDGPSPATARGPAPADALADIEADPDFVSRLERLAELRRRGDLTNEEFESAKRRLLAGDR